MPTPPANLYFAKTHQSAMEIVWNDDEYTEAVALVVREELDDDDILMPLMEDDIAVPCRVFGSGSRPGKMPNLNRRRVFYSHLLFQDFWGDSPVYNASHFKRFFKIPIGLFDDIVLKVVAHDDYFRQKKDAAGKLGLSSLQKMCCAVRQLTSGVSPAEQDDKYRMAESTGMECLKRYSKAINTIYADEALRVPNIADMNRLLDEGRAAGFPGCIGSIDCMHWEWKNCPSAWKGTFQGKEKSPTLVLEAIADNRTRFWHFNFGAPGALNDLNVLERSPLFENAVKGEAPHVDFTVNGNDYNYAYWLGDGIYPPYACFVKTLPNPATRMQKLFASAQEAKRKDIERAFGILQARFHIVAAPCRLWNRFAMKSVMKTCVILHNLIIDYEIEHDLDGDYINDAQYVPEHGMTIVPRNNEQNGEMRDNMIAEMQDSDIHHRLQHDLMAERWQTWFLENENDEEVINGDDAMIEY
jgi:Plant transposon protein